LQLALALLGLALQGVVADLQVGGAALERALVQRRALAVERLGVVLQRCCSRSARR
jgi:hypothetical protein